MSMTGRIVHEVLPAEIGFCDSVVCVKKACCGGATKALKMARCEMELYV